jgi:hypothetical protein
MADVVMEELRKDNHTIVNANAAQENRKVVDRAWQESKDTGSSTMSGSSL